MQSIGTNTSLFQDISSDDLEVYQKLAKSVEIDELQQIFQILLQLEERLKISSFSKICFEMAILQITSTDSLISLKEIVSEIKGYSDMELSKKKVVNDLNFKSDKTKLNNLGDNKIKSNSKTYEKSINQFDATSIKNLLNSEENTIYGAKVDFNIYKKISIFGEWKETFYDVDLNGSLDRIPYINMGLKLKY